MSLYLTAILPPPELSQQIDDIRKELSEQFKIYAALKPPAHITLYRPLNLDDKLDAHFVKLLRRVGESHEPFNQDLLNFGAFNIQTAFISAEKGKAITALQKEISAVIRKNKIDFKEIKGNTTFHPHVTVAYRDVPPNVFPALWNELKNRKFKRSFCVDRFYLLKHDGQKWQRFQEFPLKKLQMLELF